MHQSSRSVLRFLTTCYPDESGEWLTESPPIDMSMISTNDATRLKPFDTLVDRRARERNNSGQFLMRHAAILGKQVNNLLVYIIHNLIPYHKDTNDRSENLG